MRLPVHIDSDALSIVDSDGVYIVVLAHGTHADLERIAAALNTADKATENSDRFLEADEYTRNREVL